MTPCVLLALALCAADKTEKKADKIDGTWKVVATTFNGREVPAKSLEGRTVVIGAGELAGYVNEKKGNVNKITLDAKKKPARIDLLRQGLKEASLGIYELKGDKLTICYGEPGAGRPEKFESPEGDRVFLIVLERVKEK